MTNAEALDRLAHHQARILACIGAGIDLLALDAGAARAPLARLRWTRVRIIREYQLFLWREILDPVIARDDRHAVTARRLKDAGLALFDDQTRFIARWNFDEIAADWDEYRLAIAARSAALGRRIARERRELEAMLAGCSLDRRGVGDRPPATPLPVRSPPAARADSRAP